MLSQTSTPSEITIQDSSSVVKIEDAMRLLSESEREILVLICIKSLRYAEAAELLGVPVNTVRIRLSQARERLQNILDAQIPGAKKIRYQPPRYHDVVVNRHAA